VAWRLLLSCSRDVSPGYERQKFVLIEECKGPTAIVENQCRSVPSWT